MHVGSYDFWGNDWVIFEKINLQLVQVGETNLTLSYT